MIDTLKGYVPIRKIATVLVTGGLSWLALRSGLNLGSEAANQAAPVIVGALFGYLERDPNVKAAIETLDPQAPKT